MQITEDFDQLCKIVCPSCARGDTLRFRVDSQEWVHDKKINMTTFSHSICWANGLRKKYQNEHSG
jgi:hypothetical protein